MANVDPPKIEFPCDYPIKVIGDNVAEFREKVMAVFARHAAPVADADISERLSSGGRYISMTVKIIATGKPQLEDIHTDLKATGLVKMVM